MEKTYVVPSCNYFSKVAKPALYANHHQGKREGSHVCQVLFYFFEKPDRNSSVRVT